MSDNTSIMTRYEIHLLFLADVDLAKLPVNIRERDAFIVRSTGTAVLSDMGTQAFHGALVRAYPDGELRGYCRECIVGEPEEGAGER